MKNLFKKIKNSKGFALLFAVLAASVLLSIGLSIFTITVKELALFFLFPRIAIFFLRRRLWSRVRFVLGFERKQRLHICDIQY